MWGSGTTELSITGDSWLASQFVNGITSKINDMKTAGSHYRVTAVGSHQFAVEGGTFFKPTASIGLRRDQKNQDSIIGLELGTGLGFSNPIGLSITGDSSTLLVDYDKVQKWSLMGSLTFDHGGDKLGTMFEVSSSIGRSIDSTAPALWSSEILDEVSEMGQYVEGAGIGTELGYGLEILEGTGVLTPFTGFDYSNGEVETYHIGASVLFGAGMNLEFEISQQVDAENIIQNDYKFNSKISW